MNPTGHNPAQARAFLARLWRLENRERPGFLLGYLGPEVRGAKPVPSALFSTEGEESVRDRLLDPERYLQAQLREMEAQAALPGDFVPALCPSLGVVAIPSAFGCPVHWPERDFPYVLPVIEDRPERVRNLADPAVTDGELGRVLDYTRYFLDRTKGRWPIRITDIQGPLDSAALVWGHHHFFLAMRTCPDRVHALLEKVTDLTIRFVRAMQAVAGDRFVPSLFQPWMPPGLGLSVSNDACVMISREDHDRFCVPYLNRLSRAFGGVYVHSCGDWTHQIPSVERVERLRGVEFGASETPFEAVAERLNGKVVVACRVGLNLAHPFRSMEAFVRHVLAHMRTSRGLFIHVDVTNGITGPDWPPSDVNALADLVLHEGGCGRGE